MKDALLGFADYDSKMVKLSNTFHQEYELMHLLAALSSLFIALKYALELPGWLNYQESEFRTMVHRLCLDQQVANQAYNLRNDLVQADGQLKDGALISHPSPVQYVASVSKVDQCCFCGKRYAKNRGAHMKMMHGGLAKDLRERRKLKDNL